MRRFVLGVACFLLVAAGCSLGPKEDWTKLVRDSFDVSVDARTAKTQVTIAVEVIESVGTSEPEPIAMALSGVVDFTERRSRLVSKTKPKVDLRTDDLVLALPRSAASAGEPGWISIDMTDEPGDEIDVQDRRFAVAFPAISPTLAVEMLVGVLTGSMENEGTERVLDAPTTHYSGRMAPDSVYRELADEDREEAIGRLLETMGVGAEVVPVDIWLDETGRPRRVRYAFEQVQDRVNKFTFTQTFEFSAWGSPAKIEIPADAQRTDDFQRFVTEFVRERVAT